MQTEQKECYYAKQVMIKAGIWEEEVEDEAERIKQKRKQMTRKKRDPKQLSFDVDEIMRNIRQIDRE